MNTKHGLRCMGLALALLALVAAPALAKDVLSDSKEIMRALSDEITRSMTLQMEDLDKPYFIQYTVDDDISYQITSEFGDIISSERRRSRDFFSQVRVGNYVLDNTNFSGDSGGFGFFFGGGRGGGGRASLPLDDDYAAIRQAIWWATDQDYKSAVETLTKKRAYMEDKNIEERPSDFSRASIVELIEPTAEIEFDKAAWEANLRKITARFNKYERIQVAKAQLIAAAGNTYIVNTEGTRLRTSDGGALLIITAELQADDGMRISDSLSYYGPTPPDLPSVDKVIADADDLVKSLTMLADAPILERYTGPVMFDGIASAQLFRTLMAEGVAARVDPVGTQRRQLTGAGTLEKKIDQRIMPKSFQVFDDPAVHRVGDKHLLGHYRHDDEGVQAERVDLIIDGRVKGMVMSRVPTKKISGTNGHARRTPNSGTAETAIGCMFIEDKEGVSEAELKAQLIEAAKDEGLDYGLRIRSIRAAGIGSSESDMMAMFIRMQESGGQPGLGDPIYAYKVQVDDGREELVRGLEFGAVKLRDLKRIIAGGNAPTVYNYIGFGFAGATPATSIIAPQLLVEELELSKIEQEHDKLPILSTPLGR